MSFVLPERLHRALVRNTLGYRLMLGYAGLFIVSTTSLFLLAYYLLGNYFEQRDHDFIRTELHEYSAAYESGGLDLLRWEIESRANYPQHPPLLLRLADSLNRTIYVHVSGDLQSEDGDDLPWRRDQFGEEILPHRHGDQSVEVAARRLGGGAVLQVAASIEPREELLESFRSIFATVALPIVLVALIGGALFSFRALRPLRRLVATLRSIASTGELGQRVELPRVRGEFTEIVRLFNRMLDRVEELFLAMRRTLDDIAHDLRTPMTHLRGTGELALGSSDVPVLREAVADMIDDAESISQLLEALMSVAEAEAGGMSLQPQAVAVSALIEDVIDVYAMVAEERGVSLAARIPDGLTFNVDPGRMRQAIANVVDNAIKYTPSGGRVDVSASLDGASGFIMVSDTGIGIDQEELPMIWDRLFRGDRSRSTRGLGLGLSIVRAIVEAHGGRVEARANHPSGTTVVLTLPAYREPLTTVRLR